MPLAGFEPTISAAMRPQTYVLDRAATGTGGAYTYSCQFYTTAKSIQMLLVVTKRTNDRNLNSQWRKRVCVCVCCVGVGGGGV